MTLVTLSVVSHGHHKHVELLLRDLARQTISDRLLVILTLNVPEPEPDLAEFDPLHLRIIRNAKPTGFGANHNAALRSADSPWVMIVNPDIRINDPGLIMRFVEREVTAGVGLVAPVIYNSEGLREDAVRGNLDPVSLFKRVIIGKRSVVNASISSGYFTWFAGMFLALPLEVWRAVDGFDERFFLYCEDYDLCVRLDRLGYGLEIYEDLGVVHNAQRASKKSSKYFRWHLTSLIRVWSSLSFWRIWMSDIARRGRRR